MKLTRREMLVRTGTAAVGTSLATWLSGCSSPSAGGSQKRRILFFSKSSGFEHSAIKRTGDKPSYAETVLMELGPKHNFEFEFSKDGSLFTPAYLSKFDAYFFYTTGDLTTAGTDKLPGMTPEGKQAFLDAIKNGKGFIGTHSASDTFHTGESGGGMITERGGRYKNYGDKADPYIDMIGGEFIKHGAQQKATMRVVDGRFPGMKDAGQSFELQEEWYSLKDFRKNLHVLLVQETGTMKGEEYQRRPYPATWARMHGKGRVFYTSMGHREDVWSNPLFQQILVGGISWAVRNVNADVTPNVEQVTPGYLDIPPETPAKPAAPKAAPAKK